MVACSTSINIIIDEQLSHWLSNKFNQIVSKFINCHCFFFKSNNNAVGIVTCSTIENIPFNTLVFSIRKFGFNFCSWFANHIREFNFAFNCGCNNIIINRAINSFFSQNVKHNRLWNKKSTIVNTIFTSWWSCICFRCCSCCYSQCSIFSICKCSVFSLTFCAFKQYIFCESSSNVNFFVFVFHYFNLSSISIFLFGFFFCQFNFFLKCRNFISDFGCFFGWRCNLFISETISMFFKLFFDCVFSCL